MTPTKYKQNILQVINYLKVGGAERLVSDLIPLLSKQHCVELLVLRKNEDIVFTQKLLDAGIKIHCLNAGSLYNPLIILRIRRFLKAHPEFTIVHVHLFPSLYWVALASIGLNRELVWTEHSTSNSRREKPIMRPLERMIYSLYDRIVCISEATRQALEKWIKAEEGDKRFCVIENGVELKNFRRLPSEKLYPHTLIQVSRFVDGKDQDTVIRAMTLLPDDVHLLLVGDGARLEVCKSLAEQLGVQERVHFLGTRSDIAQLLSASDVAIQSSHWEGFGLVAVEAMANGLPVIASEVEGLKQVVEGVGVLFPHEDAKKLAQEVEHLLADSSYYNEVSKRCLAHAEKYDISVMAERYCQVYDSLLRGYDNKIV